MSDYDQRQYSRMLERLDWLEGGDFLSSLTTDLSVLLGTLETKDPTWERDFQRALGGLDEDISIAIVRWEEDGEPANKGVSFSEEAVKRMREAVAEMKRLVLLKVEAPADDAESIG